MKLGDFFKRKNAAASFDSLKISSLRRTQYGIKVFLLKKKQRITWTTLPPTKVHYITANVYWGNVTSDYSKKYWATAVYHYSDRDAVSIQLHG